WARARGRPALSPVGWTEVCRVRETEPEVADLGRRSSKSEKGLGRRSSQSEGGSCRPSRLEDVHAAEPRGRTAVADGAGLRRLAFAVGERPAQPVRRLAAN